MSFIKKKEDVIHSMVKGLKEHRNPNKVKSHLQDIKDLLAKKNQQQVMDFSDKPVEMIEQPKQKNPIAEKALDNIRTILKKSKPS